MAWARPTMAGPWDPPRTDRCGAVDVIVSPSAASPDCQSRFARPERLPVPDRRVFEGGSSRRRRSRAECPAGDLAGRQTRTVKKLHPHVTDPVLLSVPGGAQGAPGARFVITEQTKEIAPALSAGAIRVDELCPVALP